MKKCPHCLELVQEEALRCPHCSSWTIRLPDEFLVRDARKVLAELEREVREEPIRLDAKQDALPVPPGLLALVILAQANSLFKQVVDDLRVRLDFPRMKLDLRTKREIYAELVSVNYFLAGSIIRRFLAGPQFTLYAMRVHVRLLERLQARDTWWLYGLNPFAWRKRAIEAEEAITRALIEGEKCFVRDEMSKEEAEDLEKERWLHGKAEVGEEQLREVPELLEFMLRSCHRIFRVLGLSGDEGDPLVQLNLYIDLASHVVAHAQEFLPRMVPAWR